MTNWEEASLTSIGITIECVQGETARFRRDPGTGEVTGMGHFPRTWPFHYGYVDHLPDLAKGDDCFDAVLWGGQVQAGQTINAELAAVLVVDDGDHKLIARSLLDGAPPGALADTLAEAERWFAGKGVTCRLGNDAEAWQLIETALGCASLPRQSYHSSGGVLFHEGKVCVLRRPKRGEVRLPKGHIEPGEDEAATALREVREETGYRDICLERPVARMRNLFVHKEAFYVRHEVYFLMSAGSADTVAAPEAQFEPVWVSAEEAVRALTYANEAWVVRRAAALRTEDTTSSPVDCAKTTVTEGSGEER